MKRETTMPSPAVMFTIALMALAASFYVGYFVL